MKKTLLNQYLLVVAMLLMCCMYNAVIAQSSFVATAAENVNSISDRALHIMDNKYSLLDKLIQRKTEKLLKKMQHTESSLQKKLQSTDSSKAKEVFAASAARYEQLLRQLNAPVTASILNPFKEYLPGLDSVQTALQFLKGHNINLPLEKLQGIEQLGAKIQSAEGSMQKATEIQQFIKEREQQLKSQLENSGLGKQLGQLNKQAYYYQQQLAEYKTILNDPKKLEQKLLSTLRELPAFQEFMKRNSYLGQLFGLPEDYGSVASILGLQTKAQLQQLIGQRLGNSLNGAGTGSNASGYVQQQIQGAQQEIQQLQNKVSYLGLGGGGSKDIVMPDFKPDRQKTKSLLKRIEMGSSFSTSQSTRLIPTVMDMGITAGYKLNDKSIVGVGASYKMGLGQGWNHISLSSQGVGFRGFVDIKAKGSFWITGGFEYNYLNAFSRVESLYQLDAWQKSALIGVSKKYKISAKKGGNLQLLYDVLYKSHLPQSQPVIVRVGYSL